MYFLRLQMTQQPMFCIHWIYLIGTEQFLPGENYSDPCMVVHGPGI